MIPSLLLLTACTSSKTPDPSAGTDDSTPVVVDADADGYPPPADCDDADPAIHPDAPEACNGVDDDCDGATDEDLPLTPWYPDGDGDGYGAAAGPTVEACGQPDGYVANNDDCDDGDPAFHPDATDWARDGFDQDCDGEDTCDLANLTPYVGDVFWYGEKAEADMEAFCAKYDSVEGYILVSNPTTRDLRALSCLRCVSDGFAIEEADRLLSIHGLEQLRWVGSAGTGGFYIWDAPSLESVVALSGLSQVDDTFALSELESLIDASAAAGLVGPTHVGLTYLPLTDLSFLNWATDLDHLEIHGMPTLTNLDGLENLVRAREVEIVSNSVLTDVSGLSGLVEVETLAFSGDRALTSIRLPSLTRVTGSVTVESTAVTDLTDLPVIEALPNYLIVSSNTELTSLAGLEALQTVGVLNLNSNDQLADLTGLEGLLSSANVGISYNPALVSFHGLEALTTSEDLSFWDNQALVSFQGLRSLATGDRFWVWGNDSLVDFSGLDSLTTLGDVTIDGNASLVSFDGMPVLTTVEDLTIVNNGALTDLTGLYGLTSVDDLTIRGNHALPQAEIDAFLETVGLENIHGAISIEDNGP